MLRDEIKQIMPHREPMLLLDEVYLDENGEAVGKYEVRGDEWFLQGHFPQKPIVPGVIQCEMMAQACCVLFIEDLKGNMPLFAAMDKVKFKCVVEPGDTLELRCRVKKVRKPFYFTEARAYVGEKLCASGEFSFVLMRG
ncbi:MAG: 3-hydroxyacyl-ACP dehydratase FabZ [Clostridiales bacterium]|jgi:3-hydroxyacyl-[acyl-carrier-protein] dehydratase|nr:3-hydroxyacyl-ACP dehydratase FabZ [Clostridiales bacterium]